MNAAHPGVVATELGRHTGLHQSQLSSSVLSEYPASSLDSEFREINKCLPNAHATISLGCMSPDMWLRSTQQMSYSYLLVLYK